MSGTRYAVAAIALLALLALAGTSLAAQGDGDRLSRCEARVAAVAEKRGSSVDELTAQARARLTARLEAALRAGRISRERAHALRERVSRAELCTPARVFRITLAKRRALRVAGAYLGLRPAQLAEALPGTSLAALAVRQGKSVEGLETTLLAPVRARLARAVEAGRITSVRAARTLAVMERRVERLVQKVFPAR